MNPKIRNAILGAIALFAGMYLFDLLAALF